MRALPLPEEFGNWDNLPALAQIANPDSEALELIERRDRLAEQHGLNFENSCDLGRNWALRQNYEGYCYLNSRIARLGETLDRADLGR